MHLCRVDWIILLTVRPERRGATCIRITFTSPWSRQANLTTSPLVVCGTASILLFKIAVLVYQRLNGLVPSYLADDCQLVSDVRHPRRLRSSDSVTCAVRRTRTTYGDRCFAVASPWVLNSLPIELRQSDSLGQFKRRLETY